MQVCIVSTCSLAHNMSLSIGFQGTKFETFLACSRLSGVGDKRKRARKKHLSPPSFFLSLSLFLLPTTESLEQAKTFHEHVACLLSIIVTPGPPVDQNRLQIHVHVQYVALYSMVYIRFIFLQFLPLRKLYVLFLASVWLSFCLSCSMFRFIMGLFSLACDWAKSIM